MNSDHKNDISGDSLNEKSDIKDNLNGNYYNQHENDGFTFDKTENKLNKKKSLLKINDDKNHYYDAQMNKKPVLKDKNNPDNHLENNMHLSNKKGLYYNMKFYCEAIGKNVFDYIVIFLPFK